MNKTLIITVLCLAFIKIAPQFSHAYCCPGNEEFAFSADVLYWKAKQQGLIYTTHELPVFTTEKFTKGGGVTPDSDWKAGFRVGAAYGLGDSGLTTGLVYTQYFGSAQGKRAAGPDGGIFPALSFSPETFSTDYVTFAQMDWKLRTYLLDAALSGEYCITPCFSVIPSLALRNVWIKQHVRATYLGAIFSAGEDRVRLRSRFYGIGPRFGLKPILALRCGFSLYAEAAASLLYGKCHVRQKETFLDEPIAELRRTPEGFYWTGDLIAGVRWTYCAGICAAIREYSLDAGVDCLYFSGQRAFRHGPEFTLSGRGSSLVLYGFHLWNRSFAQIRKSCPQ